MKTLSARDDRYSQDVTAEVTPSGQLRILTITPEPTGDYTELLHKYVYAMRAVLAAMRANAPGED